MARFSLSPPPSASVRRPLHQAAPPQASGATQAAAPQFKWPFPPRGGYNHDSGSFSESDGWSDDGGSSDEGEAAVPQAGEAPLPDEVDEGDSDSDDMEEEPPHPLGFASRYGTTRFGPSPHSVAHRRPRDIFDRDDEYAWNALIRIDDGRDGGGGWRQSFPPMGGYLRRGGVSTQALLRGASSRVKEGSMDDLVAGMDRIANLVKAAGCVQEGTDRRSGGPSLTPRAPLAPQRPAWTSPHAAPRSTSKLLQLAAACARQQNTVRSEMSQLQQQRDQSYQQSCRGFLLLLQADEARASSARESIHRREQKLRDMEEKERLEAEAAEERVRLQREADAKAEAERAAAEAARSAEERARERQRVEQLKKAEEEAELEAAKKNEYITRATSLIANLEEVRSGLKEFDKSKSVGRRRLGFKKIVNGKINTLSHDEHKVVEVGRLVSDAIANAANDDATSGGDPVASMGKKYLLDLLCANLIVRVQADGFNGTRGDGFPLANMFALVSTTCDEIGPVLEGHLYTVCPTAIPTLSLTSAREGEGEEELMTSLGMLKDKEGKFESFDKFLHRTEGLISIMADVMSSLPPEHTLLGGHAGALRWLQRFLDLLPPPPASPLPLLTAPVLVAFLTGAGHMLANKYPEEFQRLFDAMKRDVEGRLDDSPVGVPSATRLRKVLDDDGLEGLRKDVPPGAVAGLYDGKAGLGGMGASPLQRTSTPAAASAFGPSGMGEGASSAGAGSFGFDSTSFGASSTASTAQMDNTTAAQQSAPAPSPFGGGGFGTVAPAPSPFGGGQSSGFGTTPAAAPVSAFGSMPAAPAPSPFGGSAGQPSGFGTSAPAPSPFGGGGFGSNAPAPSPGFGAPAAAAPSTGFGASSVGFGAPAAAPGPSPFGAPAAAPGPSPFGAAPAPSPFGTASAPGSSPFGAPAAAPGPSPFGTAPGPSPFGQGGSGGGNGGGGGAKKQPCKFFANGNCNFGDRCKFSHETGGNNSNPSPFGNPTGGDQPANSAFGGGGGDKKQPCKFFAQGKCRNGANCRFSHEQGDGGGFGGGSAFGGGGGGGGFGQSSNPSPFGGGGGGGNTFGSSPFGASPSPFGGGAPSSNPFGGPRR